jgi:hypothetical protein
MSIAAEFDLACATFAITYRTVCLRTFGAAIQNNNNANASEEMSRLCIPYVDVNFVCAPRVGWNWVNTPPKNARERASLNVCKIAGRTPANINILPG